MSQNPPATVVPAIFTFEPLPWTIQGPPLSPPFPITLPPEELQTYSPEDESKWKAVHATESARVLMVVPLSCAIGRIWLTATTGIPVISPVTALSCVTRSPPHPGTPFVQLVGVGKAVPTSLYFGSFVVLKSSPHTCSA